MAGELLKFPGDVMGMVLNLEEDNVGAVLFGSDKNIKEGDRVERTGRIASVPVGKAMIGRVVNAIGQPVDGTLSVSDIAFQVAAEGAKRIDIVTDEPEKYNGAIRLPEGVKVYHRDELDRIQTEPARLDSIALRLVMSHLACAERQDHPMNASQLARFEAARRGLPAALASLANSSGIFLGRDFHFDLARPGAALYGIAPVAGAANPMRAVVRLLGRVAQVREIPAGRRSATARPGQHPARPGSRPSRSVTPTASSGAFRAAPRPGPATRPSRWSGSSPWTPRPST